MKIFVDNVQTDYWCYFRSHKNSPLHEAVLQNNIVNVRKLIEKSVAIDAINSFERTPLLVACQKGYANIVRLLIESNAKVDVEDKNGKNCLDFAAHNGTI